MDVESVCSVTKRVSQSLFFSVTHWLDPLLAIIAPVLGSRSRAARRTIHYVE